MTKTVINLLQSAEAKALATIGQHGVNVVPVSMIRIVDSEIWLFDFFMDKTTENIKEKPTVALTAWTDMTGIQMKADITYITEGEDFEEAIAWVKEQNPERVVKSLLKLTPTSIYDISPGGAFTPEELEL